MSYWGEIEIIQNSQDKVNAVSNVTANFYACSSSYAGWSNYTTYPVVKLHNTQETQTLKSFDFRKSLKILIGSITTNVQHNADGKMSVSASFTWDSDHSLVGTLTGSATKELTTIPRASKVFATDADIGSSSTITINKADNSFTHTLEYSFEGLTGTIIEKTSQESVGWTVLASFFQKIPESQNGTVTITCKTYSGDTLVGTSSTTITASVPTSGENNSTPVISSATVVDTNSKTIALTDDASRLVNYFSKVKLSTTGKCLNYAGFKTLREHQQIVIPATTSVSGGTTTVKGEKVFEGEAKTDYRVTLVDTRNIPSDTKVLNEGNGDFTIVPYISLTMKANVERKSQTSNSIKMNFTGNFYNGYFDEAKSNFNNLKIKWRYKLTDSGSWITEGADDTTNGWHNLTLNTDFKYDEGKNTYQSNGEIIISDIFDYQKKYTVQISYSDELDTYTVSKPLPAGIPNHDYGVDDEGNNYFNVNGDIYQNNEKLFSKNILLVELNKNLTCTTLLSYTKITGFSQKFKVGDKLSFSNNEIKIGKGVSKVLINARLTWYAATGGLKYVWVKKNSEDIVWSTINVHAGEYASDTISNYPLEVSEGDTISVVYYTETSGDALEDNGRTYLSVEVIE